MQLLNKMKYFIATLFLFVYSLAFSEDGTKKPIINELLFYQSSDKFVDSLIVNAQENNLDTLNIYIFPHKADYILKAALARNSEKVIIRLSDSSKNTNKEIIIKHARIDYSEINDSIQRTMVFEIESYDKNDGVIENYNLFRDDKKDLLEFSSQDYVEQSAPEFAKGNWPEQEKSFWESIGEPIVMVSAAVMTTVLLFTVRSK